MLEVRAATRTRAARPWFGDSPWLACYHPFSAPNGVGLWGGGNHGSILARREHGSPAGHPHPCPTDIYILPAGAGPLADAFIYSETERHLLGTKASQSCLLKNERVIRGAQLVPAHLN